MIFVDDLLLVTPSGYKGKKINDYETNFWRGDKDK